MDLPLYALYSPTKTCALLTVSLGGGMPMSDNRTKWPVGGGAINLQPGWFSGHSNALFYINLGIGTVPENYSFPMQTVFGIVGPSNVLYDGSICIPQVPLPVNFTAVVGQNATIQVVETAQHGAALYNVSLDADGFTMLRGNSSFIANEMGLEVRRYHIRGARGSHNGHAR